MHVSTFRKSAMSMALASALVAAPGLASAELLLNDLVKFAPDGATFQLIDVVRLDWQDTGQVVIEQTLVSNTVGGTTYAGGILADLFTNNSFGTLCGGAACDPNAGDGGKVKFHFQARLVSITDAFSTNLANTNTNVGQLDTNGGVAGGTGNGNPGYEMTLIIDATETFTIDKILADGATDDVITFTSVIGNLEIWLDTTPNSIIGTGVGHNDGVKILSGTLNSVTGSFDGTPGGNNATGGSNTLEATVTSFNPNYVAPQLGSLVGTSFITSVNFPTSLEVSLGQIINIPGGIIGGTSYVGGTPYTTVAGDLRLKADATQPFKTPEPGTLLLLGAGLTGAAFGVRRKRKA